jgi:hypothetical protein
MNGKIWDNMGYGIRMEYLLIVLGDDSCFWETPIVWNIYCNQLYNDVSYENHWNKKCATMWNIETMGSEKEMLMGSSWDIHGI